MTTPINDGGPAAPVIFDHGDCKSEHPGMSLRDHFAFMAMPTFLNLKTPSSTSAVETCDVVAASCYMVADAMLKARDRKGKE